MKLKLTTRYVLLNAVFVISAAAPVFAFSSTGGSGLAPHRAVYEMTLDESRPASGVSGVQGRMVFEFAGSGCDGYTMNMRLVTQVEGETGRSIVTDLRSSTWEQGAGKRYRFNSSQYRGDKLEESTSGDAERTNGNENVEVHVIAPKKMDMKVAGPVLFPTQHSLAILKAAKSEKTILQARVYDGSSKGDKVYMTTTFIGKKVVDGASESLRGVDKEKRLSGIESWPVSISYFENGPDATETPVYQLSFRLYSNGVSRDLLIDYGDFAIKGDLSSLELMPAPKCN